MAAGGAIPERAPLADRLTGLLLRVDDAALLATTPQAEGELLHSGPLVVRYGLRYLEKPFLSVVPGLVALDYGDLLTGEDAWDFLLKRSHLHPRADVFGYRNDGVDEMIVLKRLDLALTPEVLVYADDAATVPLASVAALIASAAETVTDGDSPALPARLLAYLPRYDSLAAWRAAQTTE